MTERILPGIGLTGYWDLGAPWKVGGDQNWLRSSVLTQLSVESATTSLPPSPLNGVIYIVPAADANANQVAARDNGAWVYFPPFKGLTAYVRDTDTLMNFNGIAWVPSTVIFEATLAGAGGAGLVGAPLGASGAKDETTQERLDKTVFLSNFDDAVAGAVQLQNAINAASAVDQDLVIDQSLTLNASVTVPAGLRVRGAGGVITQNANLTPIFVCSGVGYRDFRHVQCRGKQTDYINNSTVYGAAAILITAGASASVDRCELLNFAGAGVRLTVGASDCRITRTTITGAGAGFITPITDNYGGGVVVDNDIKRWTVSGCDISQAAQGVVTGDGLEDVFITDNYIHDIIGQHGAYVESVNGLVFAGNIIKRCALLGMKVQIGTTAAPDAVSFVISSNAISSVGAQGILITNPVGGAPRFRDFVISGNTIKNATPGGNAGIRLDNAIGAIVADNVITGMERGLQFDTCSFLSVVDNRVYGVLKEGALFTNVTDSTASNNSVQNSGQANDGVTNFGIRIVGASGARLKFNANDVNDTSGFVRSALFIESGDQTSMDFEGNIFAGATQSGARLLSSQSIGKWRNNQAAGVLADYATFPSGFTTKGGMAQRYVSAAIPISGVYVTGDEILLPAPAASASPGWVVTTAGGAMTGLWTNGATYIAGVWIRNASGRVYKLVTAGGGTATVQPVGTTLGVTETGADGYTWLCMHTA